MFSFLVFISEHNFPLTSKNEKCGEKAYFYPEDYVPFNVHVISMEMMLWKKTIFF